eukprot:XP_001704429.1 Hypothetical protein GL50803_23858 [Giardia lamblia ATCC 50803]
MDRPLAGTGNNQRVAGVGTGYSCDCKRCSGRIMSNVASMEVSAGTLALSERVRMSPENVLDLLKHPFK